MTLSPRRLVFWMAAFAVAGIWAALPNPRRPIESIAAARPWIPLPAGGMDASQSAVRDLLVSAPVDDSFARHCGDSGDNGSERYRLFISKDGWSDFRTYDFVVRGEWLDVSIRDALPAPAPRQDDGNADSRSEPASLAPALRTRLAKRDAEPIRRAWDTQTAWRGEQAETGCNDGRPFVLEACVAGRYAMRDLSCGPAGASQHQMMWAALTTLLPGPVH